MGSIAASLDISLGHKDAAYVRSHFDGMEVRINDAPRTNEIMVAISVTDSGRPLPRVGGLEHKDPKAKTVRVDSFLSLASSCYLREHRTSRRNLDMVTLGENDPAIFLAPTIDASSSSLSNCSGCESGSISLKNSTTDPGQPRLTMHSIGSGVIVEKSIDCQITSKLIQ